MIYYIPGTQPDHSEKPILRTVTETLSDIPKKATWIFREKSLKMLAADNTEPIGCEREHKSMTK